jgi:hypothetical protein
MSSSIAVGSGGKGRRRRQLLLPVLLLLILKVDCRRPLRSSRNGTPSFSPSPSAMRLLVMLVLKSSRSWDRRRMGDQL